MKNNFLSLILLVDIVIGHWEWKDRHKDNKKPEYTPQEEFELRQAIYDDDLKRVKNLIKFKHDKNPVIGNFCQMTALHLSAIHKKFKTFKFFTLISADPNPPLDPDCGKITGLHIAVKENAWNFILHYMQILPKRLRNPRDQAGNTPIHLGTQLGRIDIVKYLSRQVDFVNVKNNNGDVPLHLAVRFQSFELVKFLASLDPRVNFTNVLKDTPIHEAAKVGNLEMVKFFHMRDKELMRLNKMGNSPLHYAAEVSFPIVKFIVDNVVDDKKAIGLKNKMNLTAIDIAIEAKNKVIFKFLENRLKN